MWLSSREKTRGLGANGSLHSKERFGKVNNQSTKLKTGIPGGYAASPVSSQASFGGPAFYGSTSSYNFGSSISQYGKFPRKNFKRRFLAQRNEAPLLKIDLTKPWVTEEIKTNETKKLDLLDIWKTSKNDEDWNKYKIQKQIVQSLYENARTQYIIHHPHEVALHATMACFKKFYCDACDKSFPNDDDLVRHESEHETCGREGCSFTAHPKIIAKHIKMQHDSGLYRRIGALYTKDDIAKWIEERKKRYPTRKLVEEKKAMEEEKMKRGERIKEDNSRFNKSFKSKNRNEVKKFEKKTRSRNRRQKKRKKDSTPAEEENVSSEKRDVPAFQGIGDSTEPEPAEEETEKDNLNISGDDDWELEVKHEVLKPILNNSLSLLAAYGSGEDSAEEKEDKHASDNEAPEEVTTVRSKSPQLEQTEERKIPQKRKFLNKNEKQLKRAKRRSYTERSSDSRSLTLLEKLLKDEIRRERNVILQCVHFVVRHKFFKM